MAIQIDATRSDPAGLTDAQLETRLIQIWAAKRVKELFQGNSLLPDSAIFSSSHDFSESARTYYGQLESEYYRRAIRAR